MYNEKINDISIDKLKQGYFPGSDEYICLFCKKKYQKGFIYKIENQSVDAEYAMKYHIVEKHSSVFDILVNMDKKVNGLSDIQKQIMKYLYSGKTDEEIASLMDNKAKSTIRNHRYMLREKYREAKIFLTLMDLLKEEKEMANEFVTFHEHLTVHDDRTIVTEKEKTGIIKKYFQGDKLLNFPKKEKSKLIILQHIAKKFNSSNRYSEKEINEIIKTSYVDFVTLRRYFIEYGFLDRTDNCSEYWVKE